MKNFPPPSRRNVRPRDNVPVRSRDQVIDPLLGMAVAMGIMFALLAVVISLG